MESKIRFYVCPHCGNIITKLEDSGVPVICCGEKMQEIIPNEKEAAVEKHIPVVQVKGNELVVKVGEVAHPMTDEHSIMWIAVVTDKSCNIHFLKPGEEPMATFKMEKDYVVYAYCNLHGLWKKES